MANKKLDIILADLDKEIAPLEAKRAEAHESQLTSWNFSDKEYYSGVQAKYEASIATIEKAKEIVKKHLGKK
jgi:hypothetical protein